MNCASDDAQPTVHDLPGLVVNRIFHSLGPRDLAVAGSVCRGWREHGVDSLTDRLWKGHYMERWRPRTSQAAERWQVSYADKLRQLHSYRGRAQQDRVCGHAGGVKAVGLLPAHNLLATGSTDRTVRVWDLQAGLPLASTRRLGGIVRGIAIDEELLVAATSQDHMLRAWRAAGPRGFDLKVARKLKGHTGPVSTVAFDQRNIYSGSWDYSARIWCRESLHPRALLAFPQWVDCVAPRFYAKPADATCRGSNLLVAAGPHLYIHSLETAQRIGVLAIEGKTCSVEGRRDSRLVFTGTAAGRILTHDLRAPRRPVGVLHAQHDPVSALSMEDPWLVAAHGSVTLIHVDDTLRGGRGAQQQPGGTGCRQWRQPDRGLQPEAPPAVRGLPAAGSALQCVDLRDQYVAAGAKAGVVQTFDFTHATAAEARSQAARQGRRAARQARAEHNSHRAAAAAARAAAPSFSGGCAEAMSADGAAVLPAGAAEPTAAARETHPAAAAREAHPAAGFPAAAPSPSVAASGGRQQAGAAAAAAAPAAKKGAAQQQQPPGSQHSSDSQLRPDRMPRWRIIRPDRCKFRHVDPEAYEEVEVGG